MREPIAIIGIGCRYPGGANDPNSLWQLLTNDTDAIGPMPNGRFFTTDDYYDATPRTPGKIATPEGGFIDNIDQFDAYFFGISPREANYLDPQQRLLLEITWEALEDAGQIPAQLAGSRTGVFVGMWTSDYEDGMYDASDDINLYITTGGGRYSASGRLSYAFDFRGPSMTIDTACSSSLVSVYQACQSLWNNDTELAIAGGVNLILEPQITVGYSRSGMLSPDGRCKFGDESANGYVRSEGAGMIVLKPLSQAQKDGDPIYALVRGGAINNDGRSSGSLVAPGQETQIEMLHQAYQHAGVSPGDVGYIEAHGTGTQAGDKVELGALGTILAEGRAPNSACPIGSIKTNIGHTEAASGIAGLIKAALCLKNETIPASLHYNNPNPVIPWQDLPLNIQTHIIPWADAKYASVNSFGVTGTNAHLILEKSPHLTANAVTPPTTPQLIPLSGYTEEAVRAKAKQLIENGIPTNWVDFVHTTAVRHTHHPHRLPIIAQNSTDLQNSLTAFLNDEPNGRYTTTHPLNTPPKVAFVFPGQGSQWLGMGRELLQNNPIFRQAIEACDEAIRPFTNWSLLTQLNAEPNSADYRLDQIDVIQPTLLAIEIALARVWQNWGIQPDAVIGHSMGEVAAAYIAGALTLSDAMRVICQRSKLLRRTSGQGAMAVVELSVDDADKALNSYRDQLSIAVSNSPRATVIAGDPTALNNLIDELKQRDIFCRHIKVDVASHSPQMDPLQDDLRQLLAELQPRAGEIPIYSTPLATITDGATYDANYWVTNLRQPVHFSQMVQQLLADGFNTFVEMSPHPILLPSIQQCAQHLQKEASTLASLRRNEPEQVTLLQSIGELYALGQTLDWQKQYPKGRVISLPNYPWQRERFWVDEEVATPLIRSRKGSVRQTAVSPPPADILYQLDWQPVEPPASTNTQPAGNWLIFADKKGVGQAIAQQAKSAITVTHRDSYQQLSATHFQIRADEPADMAQLFATLPKINKIIHLWNIDSPNSAKLSLTELETAQQINCGSLLHLLQSLSQQTQPPSLWIATSGAQAIENQSLSIAQSPIWGLGRVIPEEHPELNSRLIDLDPTAATAVLAQHLLTEIQSTDSENQIAIRQGQRYAARLMPAEAQASQLPEWRADSSYLITGGLGDIGLKLAEMLITQGARRLILMGRTPIPPRAEWNGLDENGRLGKKIAAIKKLEALGAAIHPISLDVGDETQLRAFYTQFQQEGWPPIRGIFHAAGLLDNELIQQMDLAKFTAVLRAKMNGAWLLHQLSDDLDHFILFSSTGSLLVQPGQANYAAANSFLDSLAHYRQQQNQNALSINWGVWQDLGLVANESGARNVQQMEAQGLHPLKPEVGLNALTFLMGQANAQRIVIPVDWQQYQTVRATTRTFPLLTNLFQTTEAQSTKQDIIEELKAADPDRQIEMLAYHLRKALGQVLKLAPERIDPNKPFGLIGLDSLMGLEYRNRLESSLRLVLSATLVWNYPTINTLAPYLAGRLELGQQETEEVEEKTAVSQPTPPDNQQLDQITQNISALSDDEALQALLGGG